MEAKLDSHILQLAAALIQHRAYEIFDSALTSFCAVRSTIVHRQDDGISYTHENQVGGMLSMLGYDCQLVILQKAPRWSRTRACLKTSEKHCSNYIRRGSSITPVV